MEDKVFHAVITYKLIDNAVLENDNNAVGQLIDLFFFIRYDDDTKPSQRKIAQQSVELFLGSNVDPSCGTHRDDHPWVAT